MLLTCRMWLNCVFSWNSTNTNAIWKKEIEESGLEDSSSNFYGCWISQLYKLCFRGTWWCIRCVSLITSSLCSHRTVCLTDLASERLFYYLLLNLGRGSKIFLLFSWSRSSLIPIYLFILRFDALPLLASPYLITIFLSHYSGKHPFFSFLFFPPLFLSVEIDKLSTRV